MEEIGKIRQNGPEAVDIQKFAAEENRSTELQLKENSFWRAHLSPASQNQEDPDAVLHHIQDLNKVTVQSVKDAANKYLSGNNLILLPEKK